MLKSSTSCKIYGPNKRAGRKKEKTFSCVIWISATRATIIQLWSCKGGQSRTRAPQRWLPNANLWLVVIAELKRISRGLFSTLPCLRTSAESSCEQRESPVNRDPLLRNKAKALITGSMKIHGRITSRY